MKMSHSYFLDMANPFLVCPSLRTQTQVIPIGENRQEDVIP